MKSRFKKYDLALVEHPNSQRRSLALVVGLDDRSSETQWLNIVYIAGAGRSLKSGSFWIDSSCLLPYEPELFHGD